MEVGRGYVFKKRSLGRKKTLLNLDYFSPQTDILVLVHSYIDPFDFEKGLFYSVLEVYIEVQSNPI